MAARFSPEQLRQALALQAKGFTQVQIAQQLGVHRKTVERHLGAYNWRQLRQIERTKGGLKARQVTQHEWMASEAIREWSARSSPRRW